MMSFNRVSLLLLCLLFSGMVKATAVPEENKTLKVISYNIWNGFEWGKDSVRKADLISWVKAQQADVMALQELCGFTDEKLAKLAGSWGHSYSVLLKTSGYSVGITANEPIEVKEKIMEDMHHGALHCKTYGIDFFVVHFSPFSHEKRHREAGVILSKLEDVRKGQENYIVLGDFNAVSPFDAHLYRGKEEMLLSMKESEKKHKHVRNLLHGDLEYGAIGAYLGFPLTDVVQKFTTSYDQRVSCPTQVFEEEKGKGRPKSSKRIDYILTSPSLGVKCTDAIVANGPETYYLSDHYPVIAEFKF